MRLAGAIHDGLLGELAMRRFVTPPTYMARVIAVDGKVLNGAPLCPARDDVDRAVRRVMAQT